MTVTATMSSITERVSRKIRSCVENRGPTRASAPRRNAVSVPMTTPQASRAGPSGLRARKIAAGTTMPASPATSGIVARRGSRSSPTETSRRTSRPMTKKNNAMTASLTQCRRSIDRVASPSRIASSVLHSRSYGATRGRVRGHEGEDRRAQQQPGAAGLGEEERPQGSGQLGDELAATGPRLLPVGVDTAGPRPGQQGHGAASWDGDEVVRARRRSRPRARTDRCSCVTSAGRRLTGSW